MRIPPSPPPLPLGARQERPPLIPAWGMVRRNRHVTVPMAVPAAFAAAGAVLAHVAHAGVPVATAAAAGTVTVAAFAHHKWDRGVEQWYARLSMGAAGGWLTWTSFAGFGLRELAALGIGTLGWGIPWWWHKRPRKQATTVLAEWAAWWQYYAPIWGVAGSHLDGVTTQGVIDTLHVQLWPGHQHLADIEHILHLAESALQGHVTRGMTRCEADTANPSRVLIRLKRANPHAVEYGWDGAMAPASAMGLMPIGRDEAGEWLMVPCLAQNWFVIGAIGGGKSNQLSVMLASLTGLPDALVWGIDVSKRGKAFRPWKDAVDWVATSLEEARLMLRCLLEEVRDRNLHGYDGSESITPTAEVPAIFLVIDEAHSVTSDMSGDPECQRLVAAIASECRSAAVRVIIATQYGALNESVGTEQIRGNLKNRLCFRVADAGHGQFALDDYAKLNAARLENPGEFYYRLEKARASAPSRAPHLDHDSVRKLAARNSRIVRPPLALYAAQYQSTYDTRYDRAPAAFRPGEVAPVAGTPPASPQDSPMRPPVNVPETPQEIAERIEDDVSAIPDLPAPPPVDAVYLADAVTRKKQTWALLLTQAPPGGIAPGALTAGSGLSRSWTHQQLTALVDLGVITKPADGRYLPVPGQDVWGALERIRETHGQLARELAGV